MAANIEIEIGNLITTEECVAASSAILMQINSAESVPSTDLPQTENFVDKDSLITTEKCVTDGSEALTHNNCAESIPSMDIAPKDNFVDSGNLITIEECVATSSEVSVHSSYAESVPSTDISQTDNFIDKHTLVTTEKCVADSSEVLAHNSCTESSTDIPPKDNFIGSDNLASTEECVEISPAHSSYVELVSEMDTQTEKLIGNHKNSIKKAKSKHSCLSLVNYDLTSGESSSEEDINLNIRQEQSGLYRQTLMLESDSSTNSDSEDSDCRLRDTTRPVIELPKVKGELSIQELPPIEDLHISVRQEQTSILGKIQSIVEQLVVVQSNPFTPAVDIDSILFLDEGRRPLGKVFDVIGPVKEPLYCVRFNSNEHIKQKQICVGAIVYFAPKTKHTSYIFVPDLLRIRGSDASWENDIEPPEKFLDYSDDEEERLARRAKRKLLEDNQQQASSQEHERNSPSAHEHKRIPYQKNYSFPTNARKASKPANKRGQSNNQIYNPVNAYYPNPMLNMMPPNMYQHFSNNGQSSSYYNYPHINNMSSCIWNGNSSLASRSHMTNFGSSQPPPPPPPLPRNPTNKNPAPPKKF